MSGLGGMMSFFRAGEMAQREARSRKGSGRDASDRRQQLVKGTSVSQSFDLTKPGFDRI